VSKSHEFKQKEDFRLRPTHLIRVSIFLAIIYYLINYLSSQSPKPIIVNDPTTILGEQIQNNGDLKDFSSKIYQSLPPESQTLFNNLPQNPVIISLQQRIDYFKDQSKDFPQKQIKEIQKELLKRFYQNALDNIDN